MTTMTIADRRSRSPLRAGSFLIDGFTESPATTFPPPVGSLLEPVVSDSGTDQEGSERNLPKTCQADCSAERTLLQRTGSLLYGA